MNIGFDAKRAFLNSSGLGNYARTLIKSLDTHFPENQYTLFTTRQAETDFKKLITEKSTISIREPESFIDKKLRSRWRSYGITDILNEKHLDVYHGLSNELPFNIGNFKGKKIVTIHDLIFLRYPKLYPFIDRKIYNKKFRHACDVADEIIAISEETKRDIEKFYFIPESKIKVVYQSCDEVYYQDVSEFTKSAIIEKYKLPADYLLYVGTIEERKNLLTIVKALKSVKDIPLVVVGNKRSYFQKVAEYIQLHKLQKRVIFLENVENSELPVIYRNSNVFIFPSVFEGFGIPIIEALTSKTPVITTKGGCFPEAGGPDTIYIDPYNEVAMAEQINKLLSSENYRSGIIEKGYEYAKRFRPEQISAEVMEIYKS
ncbi:MAG: glycosyltransferase family 4 protein [Bacteroidota bacterium]|nr:glycosyltransferase family 4 protein [Bacteroidota bacterium]